MLKKLILISSIFIISSCCVLNINKSDILAQADMVRISFYAYEDGKLNQNYQSIELTKKEEISHILDFISNRNTKFYKCGYHGSIDFLKNGRSTLEDKMEFNLSSSCNHIVFIKNDHLYSKRLSEQGVIFLKEQYDKIPEKMRF
jgi:hypothetical protein